MSNKTILVYGLSDAQKKLSENLLAKNEINPYNNPVTIASYNNELAEIIVSAYKKSSENDFHKFLTAFSTTWQDPINETSFTANWPLWKPYFDKQQNKYKFSIKKMLTKFDAPGASVNFDSLFENTYQKHLIKSGCKIGLDLAKKEKNLEIYFALDGLNFDEVIRNKHQGVTSSEIRYIYRHRNKLKDKVTFFMDNKPTNAPWIDNPKLWSSYVPKKEIRNFHKKIQHTSLKPLLTLPIIASALALSSAIWLPISLCGTALYLMKNKANKLDNEQILATTSPTINNSENENSLPKSSHNQKQLSDILIKADEKSVNIINTIEKTEPELKFNTHAI